MQKTLNIIVYKPGYGGTFISFLLSLNSLSYHIIPRFDDNHDFSESDHEKLYSYKNIRQRYGSWRNHHDAYAIHNLQHIKAFANNTQYPIYNWAIHPRVFYSKKLKIKVFREWQVNYLHVKLSPHLEYINDAFKASNNGFPQLLDGEDQQDIQYVRDYSPYEINFDNFILGEENFISEYQNVCNHLQLPLNLDTALELYRDWYEERKFAEFIK